MKICHINLAKGYRGGERQTEMLIKALSDLGITQKLVVRHDSPLIKKLEQTPGVELKATRKPYIRDVTVSRGFDLLHAHEAKAGQFSYLSHLLTRTPYLITRRILNIPKNNFFTQAVYNNALTTVALSQAIKANLHQLNPRLPTLIIPSMASHLPRTEATIAALKKRYAGKFLIGHIGALVHPLKGQLALIQAARNLQPLYPDMHFLLLGSGKDESFFRTQAEGLSNIEFLGFRENVGDYLAIFDLFIFPSLEEGLGSTLLDAMEFGVPIVASNIGGIPDIIIDQQNGLLFPPTDLRALLDQIKKMYHNPDLRMSLSENSQRMVKNFFPPIIGERYFQLYNELLAAQKLKVQL
jgi:glycosyltransferase involved in cell wall biosynthesis